jgi:hypothetical protein
VSGPPNIDGPEQRLAEHESRIDAEFDELLAADLEDDDLYTVADVAREVRLATIDARATVDRLTRENEALARACHLFTRAAHEARDALNGAGLACPSSIAFAAEQARNALVKGIA